MMTTMLIMIGIMLGIMRTKMLLTSVMKVPILIITTAKMRATVMTMVMTKIHQCFLLTLLSPTSCLSFLTIHLFLEIRDHNYQMVGIRPALACEGGPLTSAKKLIEHEIQSI